MSLKVLKLHENAQLPTRGSEKSAGMDLYSSEGQVILPGRRGVIATGISIGLPEGVYGRVAPRSGLAVKNGIHVGAGVIDPDYNGEVKVVLYNFDDKPFVLKPGYRIAQLILEKYLTCEVEEVQTLDETDRGNDGFGSTGA
jgi:dUTP pyrophosphatase